MARDRVAPTDARDRAAEAGNCFPDGCKNMKKTCEHIDWKLLEERQKIKDEARLQKAKNIVSKEKKS